MLHVRLWVCFLSSHALTSDVSIEETARAAEFFLSDGVIVTGAATGVQANPEELRGAAHITQSRFYRVAPHTSASPLTAPVPKKSYS